MPLRLRDATLARHQCGNPFKKKNCLMKLYLVKPMLGAVLPRMPSRKRLAARSSYPSVSRVWLSPGPLRRLAWIFGFGSNH